MINPSTSNKVTGTLVSLHELATDKTGAVDTTSAFISKFTSLDHLIIPKGIYLINANMTIPKEKKIVFERGAVMKVPQGVTLTYNGTWNCDDDAQIFDLSGGGILAGDFSAMEIRPEWFGAKGDGVTDDTQAFKHAMMVCYKKRTVLLGAKAYRIRETIENNSRGIKGTSKYIDSGNAGTRLIWDPTNLTIDLQPCIRISDSGAGAEFIDFAVNGIISYNTRQLAQHIDKAQFEQNKYAMFAVGYTAIEVAGAATPIFRNIQTSKCKVGLLLNSDKGHITSYDCNWAGLIGVYCKKNTEDYFFLGGGITGAFACVMLGTSLISNHYGGMSVTMIRVHLGFAPYGFYQVIDSDNYDSVGSVSGLACYMLSTRFERCGEAAIKLLPKSKTGGINISGFGFTWSPLDYPDETTMGGWVCPLPDELLARDQKQKYAVWLGTVGDKVIINNQDAGGVYKSSVTGALGSAYIDVFDGDADILGLDPANTVIRRKIPKYVVAKKDLETSLRKRSSSPFGFGNVMKDPELATSWGLVGTGTGTLQTINSAEAPAFTSDMLTYIHPNTKVLKYTPDGTNAQTIAYYGNTNPMEFSNREVCVEFYIYANKNSFRASLVCNTVSLYDHTHSMPVNTWFHVVCRGLQSNNLRYVSIGGLLATSPTYITGMRVSFNDPVPYAPYSHAHTREPIETTDGLILTDTATGFRHKVTIANGQISLIRV